MRFGYALIAALALTSCNSNSGGNDTAAADRSATTGVGKVDAALLTTGGDGRDWAMTGFNYAEQRFSPLTQINAENVGQLGLAWYADMPDARGQEATPIVIVATEIIIRCHHGERGAAHNVPVAPAAGAPARPRTAQQGIAHRTAWCVI